MTYRVTDDLQDKWYLSSGKTGFDYEDLMQKRKGAQQCTVRGNFLVMLL
jgi:hypothetical protein